MHQSLTIMVIGRDVEMNRQANTQAMVDQAHRDAESQRKRDQIPPPIKLSDPPTRHELALVESRAAFLRERERKAKIVADLKARYR
jgi:hypothetical protein